MTISKRQKAINTKVQEGKTYTLDQAVSIL